MPDSRATNRAMFWRIIRRLFGANPGRLFVMLLALGAGAAVTAALLNLQVDAKRRLTSEFRAFGPNVLVLPQNSSPLRTETLPESTVHSVPVNLQSGRVVVSSRLYLVARLSPAGPGESFSAVVAGTNPLAFLTAAVSSLPNSSVTPNVAPPTTGHECVVGTNVARQLNAQQDADFTLASADRRETCHVASFYQTGGPEDDQVAIGLRAAQRLADLPGRISVIELVVPGTPSRPARCKPISRIFSGFFLTPRSAPSANSPKRKPRSTTASADC